MIANAAIMAEALMEFHPSLDIQPLNEQIVRPFRVPIQTVLQRT
jgi:hypothetical protein